MLKMTRPSISPCALPAPAKKPPKKIPMSDNKKLRGPQDRTRVNIHEDYEARYWAKKFKCTERQLQAAVKKVGVMAKDVGKELSK
jgi:hypothetical protein